MLPELLYGAVYEIHERVGARGEVLEPLDLERARRDLAEAYRAGLSRGRHRADARLPPPGARAARSPHLAREAGFTQVSVSHEVSPLMKLVSRGDTTVADAYLSPVLRRYVERVARELPAVQLMFMQSSGGLTDARLFQGKDSILSGPAGGVVGAVRTSLAAGFDRVIGFDMGGTSTDVSHFSGQFERVFETLVAGRAHAGADDEHTHGGGGRRLHPAFRRRPLPRRARIPPGRSPGRRATGRAGRSP